MNVENEGNITLKNNNLKIKKQILGCFLKEMFNVSLQHTNMFIASSAGDKAILFS